MYECEINIDHLELRVKLHENERKEMRTRDIIESLQKKVKELDAFRLTATDFVMTKATSQEEILFLVRANERISLFQERDCIEGDEKFEDGGFITKRRHYEVLNDYEPAPSFMKALTNEILYLDSPDDTSLLYESLVSYDNTLPPKKINMNAQKTTKTITLSNKVVNGSVNCTDQMPGVIKDTLAEIRKQSASEKYDVSDDDPPSFGQKELTSLKNPKLTHIKSLNATTEYPRGDPMSLSSYQYDKLGVSVNTDSHMISNALQYSPSKANKCKAQHTIHGRQVQPSNTSQKILSSRINAYAK